MKKKTKTKIRAEIKTLLGFVVNFKIDISRVAKESKLLEGADLRRADLRWADLEGANLEGADLYGADLYGADLRRADLRRADLRWADLRWVDLEGANLGRADLDFSCWPLWCGSHSVKVDAKIARQLAAHFCVLDCEDKEVKAAQKAMLKLARKSHRAKDLGIGDTEA